MSVITYHQENLDKHKANRQAAFHKLIELTDAAGIPYTEVIELWVEGTFEAEWQGWHEYGLYEAKTQAGWDRRDCMTCDRTTEHNAEGVCQTCHTPTPLEVVA